MAYSTFAGKAIGVSILITVLWSAVASAGSTTETAEQLGNLLGSETACGLTFDKDAVRAYIEKNVPASDLDFTRNLNTDVRLAEYRAKKMGSTQQAAHCFQVKRNAEALGLLAK